MSAKHTRKIKMYLFNGLNLIVCNVFNDICIVEAIQTGMSLSEIHFCSLRKLLHLCLTLFVFSISCSFIHKTNTVEFKSATFPNAGSRHLLDDSVLESHTPTRGHAESSTLSSGISLGKTHTNTHSTLLDHEHCFCSVNTCHDLFIQGAAKDRSSARRCHGLLLRGQSSETQPLTHLHTLPVKHWDQ